MQRWELDDVLGAVVLEFDRYEDERGYFEELYSTARNYPHFVGMERQLNFSQSKKGVVRGMHVAPFAKLCSCLRGRMYDVVADVRPKSPTYLKWYGIWLDESCKKQLFVPAGCAHGFFAAEDNTILLYLQDRTYNPQVEREINWRDPQLNIKWPPTPNYILSDKDFKAPIL